MGFRCWAPIQPDLHSASVHPRGERRDRALREAPTSSVSIGIRHRNLRRESGIIWPRFANSTAAQAVDVPSSPPPAIRGRGSGPARRFRATGQVRPDPRASRPARQRSDGRHPGGIVSTLCIPASLLRRSTRSSPARRAARCLFARGGMDDRPVLVPPGPAAKPGAIPPRWARPASSASGAVARRPCENPIIGYTRSSPANRRLAAGEARAGRDR